MLIIYFSNNPGRLVLLLSLFTREGSKVQRRKVLPRVTKLVKVTSLWKPQGWLFSFLFRLEATQVTLGFREVGGAAKDNFSLPDYGGSRESGLLVFCSENG